MNKTEVLKSTGSRIAQIENLKSGYFEVGSVSLTDIPPLCRAVIESAPGKGSFIRSEVWMPEKWNGIFIGLGNGGMAGSINYPTLAHYVRLGYAAANTDLGTSRGVNSGIENPDVWKDFGWRATHIMTVVSKALIKEHYSRKESYSYFIGESTGGQQAFSQAQRFPEDYDGIIAGVPANNRIFLHTYFLWNHNHLRTPDGRVMFSPEETALITECAAEFFQLKGDGIPGDTFVTFPYQTPSTVADFISFLNDKNPGFTKEQRDALYAVYTGPVSPKGGIQIYNGMPIGSEIYYCGIEDCQGEESPHYYPFIWAFGENYNPYEFDFEADLHRLDGILSEDLNANNPDLTEFRKRGGKMIAFSGSADPCVPYPDALKYYNRVCEKAGGYQETATFFRYFIFPGKDHGGAGKGTNRIYSADGKNDILFSLRNWCEQGREPEYLIASHDGLGDSCQSLNFPRKIYPYSADKEEIKDYPKSCDENIL